MNREEARKKAEELVSQMTLSEMASQLRYDSPAIPRLGIPEYNWWNEGLHGFARSGTATGFPQAIGLGATFDPDLLDDIGDVISTEARAKYNEYSKHEDRDIYKGLTIWSPNVNLFRDPRWGRGQETYGEDPYLIARLAVKFIHGLQEGKGPKADDPHMKTAACAKHFAVHSGPEADRHHFDVEVSRKDLFETYLPQFEACVKEAGVESVMGAYNRYAGEPCCANSYLMGDVLFARWGFEGHFLSDCWAIRDFHENHKVTSDPVESAALALEQGCDLNCGCTYLSIDQGLKEGKIKEEYVKRSAIKLFTTRFLLGLFGENEYDSIPYEKVECAEHLAVAKKACEESIVMLKNDGILPIDRSKIKTIGVIGPNADSRDALEGNYFGTSSEYITPLAGLIHGAEGIRILYSEGADLFKNKPDNLARPFNRISEAVTVAEHSDMVILCLGLDATIEGEEGDTGNQFASGDKVDLSLPESQRVLIDAVIKTGTPFVVLMMTGSAMDMRFAEENASAILQCWYPGPRGGDTIADIIYGKINPSGKLPVTIYKRVDDIPDFYDYSMKGRTYRYIEKEPLYPFGFGLGYSKTKVDSAYVASRDEDKITISVKASNTGSYDAREILQAYIRTDSGYETLNARLCAFKPVNIKAGLSADLMIEIPLTAFATVDNEGERIVDAASADLFIGFGQPDKRTAELYGSEAVTIKGIPVKE